MAGVSPIIASSLQFLEPTIFGVIAMPLVIIGTKFHLPRTKTFLLPAVEWGNFCHFVQSLPLSAAFKLLSPESLHPPYSHKKPQIFWPLAICLMTVVPNFIFLTDSWIGETSVASSSRFLCLPRWNSLCFSNYCVLPIAHGGYNIFWPSAMYLLIVSNFVFLEEKPIFSVWSINLFHGLAMFQGGDCKQSY
jgi:hypothetical protein